MSTDPYIRYGTRQAPPPPLTQRQVLTLVGALMLGGCLWIPGWHQTGLAALIFAVGLVGVIGYSFLRRLLLSWPPALETAGQVTLAVLMYLPQLAPLLFLRLEPPQMNWHIALGLGTGLVLLLPNLGELRQVFAVVDLLPPIGLKPFGLGNLQLLEAAFTEEIAFRFGLLSLLFPNFGWGAILITTIAFLGAHWINRWALAAYTWRDYRGWTILSIVLGCLYLWLRDPWVCIIAHFVYNTPALLLNTLKFRRNLVKAQPIESHSLHVR